MWTGNVMPLAKIHSPTIAYAGGPELVLQRQTLSPVGHAGSGHQQSVARCDATTSRVG